jgi:predicted acylesterase/phospholipase RssA
MNGEHEKSLEKEEENYKNEEKEEKEKEKKKPNIKHIVLSGGGTIGFGQYGALRESNKRGLWSIENIESVYGISVGCIFGLVISLNFDWEVIDDYLIKRPWQNVINFTMNSLIQSFDSRGILDNKVVIEILHPLFRAKNIDINCTMKELYEITNIDLHIFVTELNSYQLIDICHTEFPDWKVVDAVYASCCLPLIFKPLMMDSCCYVDGGFIQNYPIHECISHGRKREEILGIYKNLSYMNTQNVIETSTLFDYISIAFNKIFINYYKHETLPYEIKLDTLPVGLYDIFEFASSKEKRIDMIEYGVKVCDDFLNNCEKIEC